MSRYYDTRNRSPILQDVVRGRGGLGGGWFTISSTDNIAYDYTGDLIAAETGDTLVTEGGDGDVGIAT